MGRPIRARLYVSLEGGLAMRASRTNLRFVLTDVEWVDGELALEPSDGSPELITQILRSTVVPMVA